MNEEFNVSPADFEKLTPDEVQNNENISGPSLSFGQNVWLQLKKKKSAIISAIIIILMVVISFGSTPFINNKTLVKSHPQYANLPARVPGMSAINGLNGKLKQGDK